MEKQLRQFAPFLALIVAAALVVLANPADTGGGADEATEVAGVAATRTVPTTAVPDGAATVPVGTEAPADAAPFAPPSSDYSSPAATPSFSSSSSSSGGSTVATPTTAAPTTVPAFSAPPTTAFELPAETTTTTAVGDVPGVSDFFLFAAVPSSSVCSAGGNVDKPLDLAGDYAQSKVSAEPNFPDRAGGLTLNRTDPNPERYLYRTHSLINNSSVSVTDTGAANSTRILTQRSDWERFDGITWTPRGTILVGENVRVAERADASVPPHVAKAGLVYEIDPFTGVPTVRPALGSKAHRGMAFDHLGNLYSVSATNPGFVYRYVPSSVNNYATGTLFALWVGSNGESTWLALNNPSFDPKVDADAAALAAGATQFLSPEDAETLVVTAPNGTKRSQLFIAEQGANRVLTVILRGSDNTAFTATYVAPGVNAPSDFAAPSDLAIDTPYNLYIGERNGGGTESAKAAGDDIWVAPANSLSAVQSRPAGRLASVTDCDAEPAGLTFDGPSSKLFLNLKHRGGDGRDMTLLITKSGGS